MSSPRRCTSPPSTGSSTSLQPALDLLAAALAAKAEEFRDVVKSGRTHLMDAVPVTLGQEFGGYAAQMREGRARVDSTLERLGKIPLGGTAVGNGLNTHPEFAERVRGVLCEATGLRIHPPADPFEAQANRDGLVEASGALRSVAVSLTKIANDLRWMGSGPRAGLAEIVLPELQKGSSIMPGKVNPVIPEVACQVAAQVIGNDAAIAVGGLQGNFELNVQIPLMARNLLQSIGLLAAACRLLAERCVRGHRGERGQLRAPRREHARGRDGAQPLHRLRPGDRDRQGRGRARAGRCARSPARTASTRTSSTRRSTCARSPAATRPRGAEHGRRSCCSTSPASRPASTRRCCASAGRTCTGSSSTRATRCRPSASSTRSSRWAAR